MSSTLKILMVLTSHAMIGTPDHPTGVWFEELTTPYYAFVDAGAQVDIVSIDGGKVPIDPKSMDEQDRPASVTRFLADKAAMAKIEAAPAVTTAKADEYGAIFMPGGHGTMWDLPASAALTKLLGEAWQQGRIVSAVCHGPAGLVNVKDASGKSILEGRRVSAFTNSEEEAAGLTEAVPFLLETRIRELGARYEKGENFQPYAVRDGKLVTGQNPASSKKVAQLVLDAARADVKP